MSIHPSLKLSDKDKKQRSVLKRTERLRTMLEKEEWKPGDKVCGLPKIKTLKIRIKKEKTAEKTEEVTAAEGVAPAASESKEQPSAKGAAAKKSGEK
ncbi:MAG: small basic protein [Candidatus Omnitrophota bacterium]